LSKFGGLALAGEEGWMRGNDLFGFD